VFSHDHIINMRKKQHFEHHPNCSVNVIHPTYCHRVTVVWEKWRHPYIKTLTRKLWGKQLTVKRSKKYKMSLMGVHTGAQNRYMQLFQSRFQMLYDAFIMRLTTKFVHRSFLFLVEQKQYWWDKYTGQWWSNASTIISVSCHHTKALNNWGKTNCKKH